MTDDFQDSFNNKVPAGCQNSNSYEGNSAPEFARKEKCVVPFVQQNGEERNYNLAHLKDQLFIPGVYDAANWKKIAVSTLLMTENLLNAELLMKGSRKIVRNERDANDRQQESAFSEIREIFRRSSRASETRSPNLLNEIIEKNQFLETPTVTSAQLTQSFGKIVNKSTLSFEQKSKAILELLTQTQHLPLSASLKKLNEFIQNHPTKVEMIQVLNWHQLKQLKHNRMKSELHDANENQKGMGLEQFREELVKLIEEASVEVMSAMGASRDLRGEYSAGGNPGYKSDIDTALISQADDQMQFFSTFAFSALCFGTLGDLSGKKIDTEAYIHHPAAAILTETHIKTERAKEEFARIEMDLSHLQCYRQIHQGRHPIAEKQEWERYKYEQIASVGGAETRIGKTMRKSFAQVEAFEENFRKGVQERLLLRDNKLTTQDLQSFKNSLLMQCRLEHGEDHPQKLDEMRALLDSIPDMSHCDISRLSEQQKAIVNLALLEKIQKNRALVVKNYKCEKQSELSAKISATKQRLQPLFDVKKELKSEKNERKIKELTEKLQKLEIELQNDILMLKRDYALRNAYFDESYYSDGSFNVTCQYFRGQFFQRMQDVVQSQMILDELKNRDSYPFPISFNPHEEHLKDPSAQDFLSSLKENRGFYLGHFNAAVDASSHDSVVPVNKYLEAFVNTSKYCEREMYASMHLHRSIARNREIKTKLDRASDKMKAAVTMMQELEKNGDKASESCRTAEDLQRDCEVVHFITKELERCKRKTHLNFTGTYELLFNHFKERFNEDDHLMLHHKIVGVLNDAEKLFSDESMTPQQKYQTMAQALANNGLPIRLHVSSSGATLLNFREQRPLHAILQAKSGFPVVGHKRVGPRMLSKDVFTDRQLEECHKSAEKATLNKFLLNSKEMVERLNKKIASLARQVQYQAWQSKAVAIPAENPNVSLF